MTTTREQAAAALFTLLSGAYAFQVTSRRFKSWDAIASSQKPAFFLLEHTEEHLRNKSQSPALRILMCTALIFIADGKDPNVIPDTTVNNIIDSIDPVSGGVLKPDNIPAFRQTLGGLVYDCFIEGKISRVPGDVDGQGMIVIPIKIIFNQ